VSGWVFSQPPVCATVVTAIFLVGSGLAAAVGVALARLVQRSEATVGNDPSVITQSVAA